MNPTDSVPAEDSSYRSSNVQPVNRMAETHGADSTAGRLAGALLGVAILLLTRRYSGINHDSVLYLGQALMHQSPEIFGSDLFFLHGSQERYSLFPWVVGKALGWLEPPTLFLWGALASSLLFAAASWYCVRSLLPVGQRYWAWLGVLCLPSFYGMIELFSYGEQFFTPRPIAELLSLLCIAQLARHRLLAAAGCLALAALFHPLQAIAAALVAWPWLVMQDRRWLHAIWLGIPVAVLAAVGAGPFGDLFRQADPDWLARLRGNTPQLFLSKWDASDYRMLALDALLLVHASMRLRGRFGRWCVAALVGLALGVSASLVLVDGLHLVLPAGLQLWRVQWLAHWFAMAGLAAILYTLANARDWPRAILLVLVALLAWSSPGWLWLPLAALYVAWPKLFGSERWRLQRLLACAFGMGIAILAISYALSEWMWFGLAHHRLDLYAVDRRLLAYPLLALGLPLLGVHLWQRAGRPARLGLLVGGLLPLLAISALRWDARPPLNRAFEGNAARTDIFGVDIPEDAQVFWDAEMTIAPWLVLHRASYYSGTQLAGEIFSRDTAMDGHARADRMMPLMLDSRHCQDRSRPLEERMNCRISDKAIQQACGAGPARAPEFLVLPYPQPQQALGRWDIMDSVEREPLMTFRLYRCADLLHDPRAPSAS